MPLSTLFRIRNSLTGLALGLTLSFAPIISQPAKADAKARDFVESCVLDLLPHEAAGICAGKAMEHCLTPVTNITPADSLRCWAWEEAGWDDWAKASVDEAAARLGLVSEGAEAKIAAALASARAARDSFCALHREAWGEDDDGPLMEARCRSLQAAFWAVQVFWLGLP